MSVRSDRLFQEIYEKYYHKVLGYITSRVNDAHTAEDLASDVFFKCYRNLDRYDAAKGAESTWIFTITNNTLKNHYRDRKLTSSIDAMEGFDVPFEEEFDHAMRLEEIRAYLDEALDELDEISRRILVMRFYDEMKTKEIAARVGLTESNVRVKLSRTLKRLRVDAEDAPQLRVL